MTKKKDFSAYNAALRRKEILKAKREKADRYVEMMNKRANDERTSSQP